MVRNSSFGYNGQAKTGFCTINGNRYYFNDKGELHEEQIFQGKW